MNNPNEKARPAELPEPVLLSRDQPSPHQVPEVPEHDGQPSAVHEFRLRV